MPVNSPRPEYEKWLPRWLKYRDCYDGGDAVKDRGIAYLPMLDSQKDEMSPATLSGVSKLTRNSKYEEYKTRALFYNATSRTVDGLSGSIFQKELVVELPTTPNAETDAKDITLAGESIEMYALKTTREVLKLGRFGTLTDMSTEEADERRPYWVAYKAEDIISWRAERKGGDEILTRVIVREYVEQDDPDDPYEIELVEQYRVLQLDADGVYTQEVWIKEEPDKEDSDYIFKERIVPTRRGEPLTFIPFVFFGPRKCSHEIEKAPVDDLVEVNLSHYRASADLKHGLHYAALPTPWAAGLAGTDTGPVKLGSGSFLQLTENGKAGMLEVAGPGFGAIAADMERMEGQMATLGARLLESQSPVGPEATETVSMRHSGEQANLRTVAQAVEEGLTLSLRFYGWWMGTAAKPEDVECGVELNKEFFTLRASPEEVKAALLAWQSDGMSWETFYERLQQGGWAREGVTAEQEMAAIKKQQEQRQAAAAKQMELMGGDPAGNDGGAPKPPARGGTPPPTPPPADTGVAAA